MSLVITVIHVAACFFLIAVVLLQTGKGADIGAVFGGSSQTIFGSSGAGNLLTRLTTWTAAVFMLTSIFLTWDSTRHLTISIADDAPIEPPPLEAPADTGTTTTAPEAAAPAAQGGGAEGATENKPPAGPGPEDLTGQGAAEAGSVAPAPAPQAAAGTGEAAGDTGTAAPAAPAAPDAAGAPQAGTEGERAPDAAAAGAP